MGELISNADAITRRMREKLEAGIALATIRGAELYKKDLDVPYPPSSKVGEHPHRRTGRLRDEVTYSLDLANLRGRYGATTEYIIPLIDSGRLGPADSARKHRQEIVAEFVRGALGVGDF